LAPAGADGLRLGEHGSAAADWAEVPLARAVDTLHLPLPGDPVAVGMGNPHCVFFVRMPKRWTCPPWGRIEHDPCSRSAPMWNSPA
jgi:diaminopimelate epimerase